MIKKPNVLIAGFPRSGTTHIHNLLIQHPDIFIPQIKGPQYFNKDHFFLEDPEILNPRYFRPKEWYFNFFRTNKKVVIDFSYQSALDVASARRAYNLLGDIKVVFIVWNKEAFKKSVKGTVERWRAKISPEKLEELSDFEYYIQPYKNLFSRVHIFHMDEFDKDKEKELDKLLKFLDLKKHKFNFNVNQHRSKDTPKPKGLQYWRHKGYFFISNLYYKFLSLNAWAKAKA